MMFYLQLYVNENLFKHCYITYPVPYPPVCLCIRLYIDLPNDRPTDVSISSIASVHSLL